MTKTITVYTTILNHYDHLRAPGCDIAAEPQADFVCFSDEPYQVPAPWRLQPAYLPYPDDAARNSRVAKVLSHLFIDTEYSIWHDGNLQILAPPYYLIDRWLTDVDIAVVKHHFGHYDDWGFDCIYKEAETCIRRDTFETALIQRQADAYRAQGHPEHWGLFVCGFILRRHTPAICRMNEEWWHEIVTYSARDQISFPFVLRKSGIRFAAIEISLYNNEFFKYYRHARYASHTDNLPFAEQQTQEHARKLRLSVLCARKSL
jgi:hypothetical protein